jgi:hypothetical protein
VRIDNYLYFKNIIVYSEKYLGTNKAWRGMLRRGMLGHGGAWCVGARRGMLGQGMVLWGDSLESLSFIF